MRHQILNKKKDKLKHGEQPKKIMFCLFSLLITKVILIILLCLKIKRFCLKFKNKTFFLNIFFHNLLKKLIILPQPHVTRTRNTIY